MFIYINALNWIQIATIVRHTMYVESKSVVYLYDNNLLNSIMVKITIIAGKLLGKYYVGLT